MGHGTVLDRLLNYSRPYIGQPPVRHGDPEPRIAWLPWVERAAMLLDCPTCPQGVAGMPCAADEPACEDRLRRAAEVDFAI